MRRKLPSLVVCVVLAIAMFVSVDLSFEVVTRAKSATIYVPYDYPTIQEAIDAASDGDTVFIYSCPDPILPYRESIVIDKNIDLIGEDRKTTIIEGGWSPYDFPPAITISSEVHNTKISGFTISYGGSGISIYGKDIIISGNKFVNNGINGAIVVNSADNIISNNIINGAVNLYSGANRNLISGNTLTLNYQDIGLYYTIGNELKKNTITGGGIIIKGNIPEYWTTHLIGTSNIVNGSPICYWKNKIGGTVPHNSGQVILANCTKVKISNQDFDYCSVGVELGFCSGINITGITSSFNSYGIYLRHSKDNFIAYNKIYNNYFEGIFLEDSNNNNIIRNSISENGHWVFPDEELDAGITLTRSLNNRIYHNNFVDNIIQAQDDRKDNYWNDNYPCGGNYWSDYWGEDLFYGSNQNIPGADGIGDTPYVIDKNSWDRYPLISPYIPPTIPNFSPNANAGIDQDIYLGQVVEFNGSNSTDPEGDILNYIWDYGDGSPNGIGANPIHTFTTEGEYIVTLTVWDNYRNKDTDTCIINVTYCRSIYLDKGWNLISLPTIQLDIDIKIVLQSINGEYNIVQYYNSSDKDDPWKAHVVGKPISNDLIHIYHTISFWINITQPGGAILILDGAGPSNTSFVGLHPGWNMVGYPSLGDKKRTAALNNLVFGSDVDSVWMFNAATHSWREIGENDYFEIGRGYWVHAKKKCVWEVPV